VVSRRRVFATLYFSCLYSGLPVVLCSVCFESLYSVSSLTKEERKEYLDLKVYDAMHSIVKPRQFNLRAVTTVRINHVEAKTSRPKDYCPGKGWVGKETQTTVGQRPIGGYLSSRPLQASHIDQANLR